MKLYIGNKNYSSWSMRPWVALKNSGVPFEEIKLSFGDMSANSLFKQTITKISPVGKVPALVDGDLVVWDSLAICEYAAEKFPDLALWPKDAKQRARARSITAEMHSGFGNLRSHCPMNIEADLSEIGAIKLRDEAGVRADVHRIEAIWSELLTAHGGPYLFGSRFCIADAFYAPVVMRFASYGLSQRPEILSYMKAVKQSAGVAEWIAQALKEHDFIVVDEPYRAKR